MSPPIRDGSGSSIGSIRLGDGSEISEVRTGAGDVVFSAAPPDSGGAHQWNTDEGSGTTWGDSIGSLDGSIVSASWVTGSVGAGGAYLSFDGSDDYIDIPNSASKFSHWIGGHGTWFAWVKRTASNFETIVSANQPFLGNNGSFGFRREGGGGIRARARNSNGNRIFDVTAGSIARNEWRAVAVTADGSRVRIYTSDSNDNLSQNGSTSISNTQSVTSLNDDIRIGSVSTTEKNLFTGDMDIHWTNDIAVSQSAMQSFVNDTKQFYP